MALLRQVAVVEVNALVYPGGGDLGPHTDLVDKLATIILYFNPADCVPVGGRFLVLGSRDVADVTRRIDPIFGNAVLVVRSDCSWHAVEEVSRWSRASRRAVTVTFYRRGSRSTMWPNGNDGDLAIHI